MNCGIKRTPVLGLEAVRDFEIQLEIKLCIKVNRETVSVHRFEIAVMPTIGKTD